MQQAEELTLQSHACEEADVIGSPRDHAVICNAMYLHVLKNQQMFVQEWRNLVFWFASSPRGKTVPSRWVEVDDIWWHEDDCDVYLFYWGDLLHLNSFLHFGSMWLEEQQWVELI